jgi:hypothetical protein
MSALLFGSEPMLAFYGERRQQLVPQIAAAS